MSQIVDIKAGEILSSGGKPTIKAEVSLKSGVKGIASVPFGASAGSHEMVTLTDGDKKRYGGAGMKTAVDNINHKIRAALLEMEAGDQNNIDRIMIELDGTDSLFQLGGNAILAVSLAVARASAEEEKMPLYQYLRKYYETGMTNWPMPKPMAVMIEGGKHAANSTDFQEYLVDVCGKNGVVENVRIMAEIYEALGIILKKEGLSTNVGNEGAFAPEGIKNNEKPLEYLTEAIKSAGYKPGVEAMLSIDAAASEFYSSSVNSYELRVEDKRLKAEELIEYYLKLAKKYPILTMEDMLAEDDWENWVILTEKLGKIINIGDDLTVTKTERLREAIRRRAITGVIIKLNQAGTLTETMESCLLARQNGLMIIPSHRGGGETNDTFMVDLAVAVGADFIKVGPTRGERVEKYNRLMEIEEELELVTS